MRLENLVNLVIDANIAVLIAALAVALAERLLKFLGYSRSYKTRLWLVVLSVYALLAIPLLTMLSNGKLTPQIPSFTDLLVSQYLKGHISVSATSFDNFLSFRTQAVEVVSDGSSVLVLGITALFLTAAAARVGFVGLSLVRLLTVVRGGVLIRKFRRVRVILSDQIDIPFSTRGLVNYYVVLPQSMMTDPALMKISLGHELQHIRQTDINSEILLAVVSPLFALNPAFWYLSRKIRNLREFACDFSYLKRSNCTPRDYANGLLQVAETAFVKSPKQMVYAFSVPLVGQAASGLSNRIIALSLGESARPGRMLILGLGVMVFCLSLLGITAAQHSTGWSHERIMVSTVANLERLNLRNR